MTTQERLERVISDGLRAEADRAMARSDTEHELARLRSRRRRDVARRRTTMLVAAACALAALVAAGVVGSAAQSPPPPADHHPRPDVLRLGDVPAPDAVVRLVGLPDGAPTVALGHRLDGLLAEPDGRWWTLSGDPATQEWTLRRLAPDHRTVETQVRFATSGSVWGPPWAAFTGDVVVLALPEGGVLPGAERFADRRDGLLRIDRRTGRVLGFTPVETATTVEPAADGTVWAVVSPQRVGQFDPRTGRALRMLATPGIVDRALVQGDRLWVTNQQASPVRAWQLDERTGAVLRTAVINGPGIHLPSGDSVIVVRPDGRVVRVQRDGTASAVQLRLPAGLPVTNATTDGRDVWLWLGVTGLVRLSATTLAVDGAAHVPWDGVVAVGRTARTLLLAENTGVVHRVPLRALISPP